MLAAKSFEHFGASKQTAVLTLRAAARFEIAELLARDHKRGGGSGPAGERKVLATRIVGFGLDGLARYGRFLDGLYGSRRVIGRSRATDVAE